MAGHGHSELGLIGENFDPGLVGRMREDGYESRSGSDNAEGASGDDQDASAADGQPNKKKYHRHTPFQIQELEYFFKQCPHPDDKQRSELSMRLGLENKQIKFWFQNRRTQMKNQVERHENAILRQENDKLRAENDFLKQAMTSPVCNGCGGPALPGEISYEQNQLRIENARLKEELNRISTLTNKFFGRPFSSSTNPIPTQGLTSNNLELAVGRNGYGCLNNTGSTLPMGFDFGDGTMVPIMKPVGNEMQYDRSVFVDVALAAMDELIKMTKMDSPLWVKGSEGGIETLNLEEYRRMFSSCFGMKPSGCTTEATRQTGIVFLRGLALVETLMEANRWAETFPCLITRAATIDVLSSGTGVTRDNALQLMDAEFQVLSPLAPLRQVRFIRFCKQHSESMWAVVDVSIDASQDTTNTQMFTNCRRLPSGCVIEEMEKYSKQCLKLASDSYEPFYDLTFSEGRRDMGVTWVEHSEYDESTVHHLLQPLLSSGFGFGAQRWIATLQRQSEYLAALMSPNFSIEDNTGIAPAGRKSILKLAQRMTYNFCAGVCASSVRKWEKLSVGNVGEDVKVMTRKNINDPGEPSGVLLSAATSVWMPITKQRLFAFLRDERMRSQWDILSNGGPMQEVVEVAKGPGNGNRVSLLRGGAVNTNENMVILQETWFDASGALVVYAPVDITSLSAVFNGGDSAYVALLPSGFAILPDISSGYHGRHSDSNQPLVTPNVDESTCGGCLLTVGFQILVNNAPTAQLTVESVETVNNLISCTIEKIKAAVSVP